MSYSIKEESNRSLESQIGFVQMFNDFAVLLSNSQMRAELLSKSKLGTRSDGKTKVG